MTIRLSSRVASRLHALACDEITRSHVDALSEISAKNINSTLVNYLLAQTFAKPLSASLRASIGRLSRGQEDIVHLASTNSVGQRMFFIGHGMADSTSAQHFGSGVENDNDDWQVVSPDEGPAFDGGGGSGEGGEQVIANEPPEGGPLSAILFEVGG